MQNYNKTKFYGLDKVGIDKAGVILFCILSGFKTMKAASMNIFNKKHTAVGSSVLAEYVNGYSIEVMPKTLAKIEDLSGVFPKGTRVYIAHIEGTDIKDMVHTARRLRQAGYDAMPHFPARLIADKATLENWLNMYKQEANVEQALLLGGGVNSPKGEFDSSMQLVETGLLDKYGFTRIHFAGHPEGNKDIDKEGGNKIVDDALNWKQKFTERSDAKIALTTQFIFEADPLINWSNRIAQAGVDIPIHVGLAGPAKLQTLIKYSIACGVGPSLKVLKKRATDLTKLLLPYTPDAVATDLATYNQSNPNSNIESVHLFPLGGIKTSVNWASSIESSK